MLNDMEEDGDQEGRRDTAMMAPALPRWDCDEGVPPPLPPPRGDI